MPDNVNITAGTGTAIAADEAVDPTLGTVKFQYVKLVDGTLDSTTKVGATANGLKVDGSAVTQPVSAPSLPLPSGASTSAKQPALGTAGTPSADVLTVQGVTSMTALKVDGSAVTQPVSGTVTVQQSTAASLKVDLSGTSANATAVKVDGSAVTQPVSGTVTVQQGTAASLKVDLSGTAANATAVKVDGSAVTQPVSGTVAATLSSSTNAGVTAKTSDYDTGAGTDTVTMYGVALPASGGAVIGGTSTSPLRTDPTGTTTQPVSGTVTANAGTGTMAVSAASLPLPSGAATSTKQPALGTAGTASADVITVQGIASMTALKIDGSGVTQPISGTVTVQQSTAASLKVDLSGTAANATALKVDGSAVTQPVSIAATLADNITQFGGAAISTGTGAGGTGIPRVTVSTDSSISLGTSQGKTVVLKTGTLASSAATADQVVLTYTVTTGKTFYLCSLDCLARLTTFAATATNFGTISLENPSGTKLWTMDMVGTGVTAQYILQFPEGIPIASATVIRVVCTPSTTTAFTWRANFGGYEK